MEPFCLSTHARAFVVKLSLLPARTFKLAVSLLFTSFFHKSSRLRSFVVLVFFCSSLCFHAPHWLLTFVSYQILMVCFIHCPTNNIGVVKNPVQTLFVVWTCAFLACQILKKKECSVKCRILGKVLFKISASEAKTPGATFKDLNSCPNVAEISLNSKQLHNSGWVKWKGDSWVQWSGKQKSFLSETWWSNVFSSRWRAHGYPSQTEKSRWEC